MTTADSYDLAFVQPTRSSPPVSAGPLGCDRPFGRFANDLLALELPDLPADRRSETVEFVCRRATAIPGPLRLGVIGISLAVGVGQRLLGGDRSAAHLQHVSLPLLGELPRLVRSLGFAYVWETWPNTSPTGAP